VEKLRCGIIGCGRVGCGFDDIPDNKLIRTHALSYYKNSKSDLIALCDVDKNKLKKYGKKYSANTYTESKEMLENESLDCVSICTKIDSHLKLVKECIENGIKGIIIEKPFTDSLFNAKQIIKICSENNVVLSINHQRRFDPFYHKLSHFIKTKSGDIQHVNLYYGGGIVNTGSHIFDVLRVLFGDAISIHSKFSKNNSNNKKDPNLDVTIKFKNNIICNLFALDSKKFGLIEIDILGTKNRIIVDMVTNKNKIYRAFKGLQDYKKLQLSKQSIQFSKPATDLRLVFENVINCINNNKMPLCTGLDGYKSLEMTIASIMSAKNNEKIKFPTRNTNYKIKLE
jgi:predicted dehydrogenase